MHCVVESKTCACFKEACRCKTLLVFQIKLTSMGKFHTNFCFSSFVFFVIWDVPSSNPAITQLSWIVASRKTEF